MLWSQCQEGILQKVPMHWSKCPIKMVIGKWCILQFSTFKTASWKIWIVPKHRYFACNELYRIQNTFSAFISRRCAIFWPKRKLLQLCLLLQHFKCFLKENIVAFRIKILQANSVKQNILFLLANHPNFSASKYWRILLTQS